MEHKRYRASLKGRKFVEDWDLRNKLWRLETRLRNLSGPRQVLARIQLRTLGWEAWAGEPHVHVTMLGTFIY